MKISLASYSITEMFLPDLRITGPKGTFLPMWYEKVFSLLTFKSAFLFKMFIGLRKAHVMRWRNKHIKRPIVYRPAYYKLHTAPAIRLFYCVTTASPSYAFSWHVLSLMRLCDSFVSIVEKWPRICPSAGYYKEGVGLGLFFILHPVGCVSDEVFCVLLSELVRLTSVCLECLRPERLLCISTLDELFCVSILYLWPWTLTTV